ncbi:MAG: TolB family protein [Chloroherpetonaceae bacterium]
MKFVLIVLSLFLLTSFTPLEDLPPIAFVARHPAPDSIISGIGPHGRTFKTGGKLFVRERSGRLRQLAPTFYDIADLSVSYDAKRLVFSGLVHPDSSWRIYEIGIDGRNLRAITKTDRTIDLSRFGDLAKTFERYDDFDPCYMDSEKIVFASTRYPSLAQLGSVRTSNLFVVNTDGTNLHRITTERNSAEEPTMDLSEGRVVFSRWWLNLDLPSNQTKDGLTRTPAQALTDDIGNIWHAITAKPDGDELKLYAGFARTRAGLQAYKPRLTHNGDMLAIFTSSLSMLHRSDSVVIRRFKKGASVPMLLSPLDAVSVDAVEVSPNKIIYSQRKGGTFGLYLTDSLGSFHRKILDLPKTDELCAVALVPRPVPTLFKDQLDLANDQPPLDEPTDYADLHAFRFDCFNIFMNGKVDEPIPDAPKIVQGAKVRFYMNIQRKNADGKDIALLFKELPVDEDGGIREPTAPAEVPLFEQLVDSRGNLLTTSSGKIAHVSGLNSERKGAGTKCVGCHTGHSLIEVPMNNALSQWFNAATSAHASASSEWEQSGVRYHAARAIDRQVELGCDTSMWVSAPSKDAWLNLKWDIPIVAREVVLYPISKKSVIESHRTVKNGRIALFSDSKKVKEVTFDHLQLLRLEVGDIPINELTVRLESDSISHFGLGEIEVIARLLY